MNAGAWQDYRRIWTATTRWRDPRTSEWVFRLAMLTALAAGAARIAGVLERAEFWKAELGVAMLWFGALWVLLFIPASVLMNSAQVACLVPRLRCRLLQMAGASLMVLTVGGTLVLGDWKLFPLVASYLLGFMLLRAGVRPAVALMMLPMLWPMLARRVLPPSLAEALLDPGAIVVANIALMLLAAWSLARLYPAGGDRHLDGRAEQVGNIERLEQREMRPARAGSLAMRLAYLPALRCACRERKPAAMLMHALGPGAHWSAWGAVPLIVGAIALVLLVAPLLAGRPVPQAAADWLMGFSAATLSTVVLFSASNLCQQVARTRGEQALLRLTPLAGSAALLNRRLGWGLLKAALANWAMLSASLLLLAWLLGAGGDSLLRDAALCCLGGEVAVLGLLRDYSREGPGFSLLRLLLLVPVGAANLGLAWLLARLGGSIWLWLTLLSIGGGVAWILHSWRTMMKAPPAFPAGRIDTSTNEVKA